ncbi:unnamed protein product, partial [Polarella glacialis]
AKSGFEGQSKELQQMLSELFEKKVRQRVRANRFRPAEAGRLIRRELVERRYEQVMFGPLPKASDGSETSSEVDLHLYGPKRAQSKLLGADLLRKTPSLDAKQVKDIIM